MTLVAISSGSAGGGTLIGLVIFVAIALGISFMCSVLEAVLLSASASYLELAAHRGSRAAKRLRRQKQKKNIDRSISAILTLNTIAHTVGAAGAGAEAAAIFGSQWIGLIGAVLTFLILVVSEIIPKTIGAVYWRALMPFTAYTLSLLLVALSPILWCLQWITDALKPRTTEPTVTRAELEILAQLGREEGSLGEGESLVLRNLLRLDRVRTSDILTPRTVLFALPASQTAGEAVTGGPLGFSRIPLFRNDLDDIVSFVLRFDILEASATGRANVTLQEISRPLKTVSPSLSVKRLLDMFIAEEEHMFLVGDEYGGTVGIVTLEDAIESLLGAEITDESDIATDMREMAKRRAARRQRLARRVGPG